MSDTNIPVSDEVWKSLNSRKSRGDTFDDVIRRILNDAPENSRQVREADTRESVKAAVSQLDWDQADVAHTDAREAAIVDAVEVVAFSGVASRRTVKQIVKRSDRDLELKPSSRERMAADLVQRVPRIEAENSDLTWTDEKDDDDI